MDTSYFSKYQHLDTLTTVAVDRLRPCYEIAKLFVVELNKTAGQPYVTKAGKKGRTKTYTEVMVLADLRAINTQPEVMTAFLSDCEKSTLGFRRYYSWKIK